ncbi:hypothetical protein V6N11_020753 [Hibiscus sabdariffa]|uniref:Cytochrome P450 n=1 Tax=Hibiscus sabdariffa TaxID=183260 RepID=A0ABR2Q9D7_9ROSI
MLEMMRSPRILEKAQAEEKIERCEINGYEIPAKTKVIVNAWEIRRDSNHWNEAERFNSERFTNISIDFKETNFELIPFGAGRRMYPGMSYVTDEHLVGNDFSSKRAKILTNHMELIEESISLNCDGALFKVWVRELNSTLRSAPVLTNSKEGFLESGYNSEEIYSKQSLPLWKIHPLICSKILAMWCLLRREKLKGWWLLKFQSEKAGALVPDSLCPEVELMNGIGRFNQSMQGNMAINLASFEKVDAQCLGTFDSTQAPMKQPLQCVEPQNLNNVDIFEFY